MDGRAPEHVKDAARGAVALRRRAGDPPGAGGHVLGGRPPRRGHPRLGRARRGAGDQHGERAVAPAAGAGRPDDAARGARASSRGKKLAVVWTHSPTPASAGGGALAAARGALRAGMNVASRTRRGYELDERGALRGRSARRAERRRTFECGLAPRGRGARARTWSTRAPGSRSRTTATRRWPPAGARARSGWTVDEKLMALGDDGALDARDAGAAQPRGHRRGARRTAQPGLRAGREPAALAEGAARRSCCARAPRHRATPRAEPARRGYLDPRMSAPDFVHLHVHSEYSLLDGANRIRDLVRGLRAGRAAARSR